MVRRASKIQSLLIDEGLVSQEAWDSGRRIGPRTHVTGFLTDGNRVYYSMAEGIVSSDHLQMALDRSEALKLDFIKTYVRLPDHWQKTVVDFAHRHGAAFVPVHPSNRADLEGRSRKPDCQP